MKTTIVNYENVYEFDELIDFLRDELDFDLYEDGNSIIQLFEGDPDCLFIDNKKIIFTEFNINENLKAVIYINLYDID